MMKSRQSKTFEDTYYELPKPLPIMIGEIELTIEGISDRNLSKGMKVS
jgi:hypothetical protein